jgi:hypothetical protein
MNAREALLDHAGTQIFSTCRIGTGNQANHNVVVERSCAFYQFVVPFFSKDTEFTDDQGVVIAAHLLDKYCLRVQLDVILDHQLCLHRVRKVQLVAF